LLLPPVASSTLLDSKMHLAGGIASRQRLCKGL
jgi:hypothetical protein